MNRLIKIFHICWWTYQDRTCFGLVREILVDSSHLDMWEIRAVCDCALGFSFPIHPDHLSFCFLPCPRGSALGFSIYPASSPSNQLTSTVSSLVKSCSRFCVLPDLLQRVRTFSTLTFDSWVCDNIKPNISLPAREREMKIQWTKER